MHSSCGIVRAYRISLHTSVLHAIGLFTLKLLLARVTDHRCA